MAQPRHAMAILCITPASACLPSSPHALKGGDKCKVGLKMAISGWAAEESGHICFSLCFSPSSSSSHWVVGGRESEQKHPLSFVAWPEMSRHTSLHLFILGQAMKESRHICSVSLGKWDRGRVSKCICSPPQPSPKWLGCVDRWWQADAACKDGG